MMKKKMNSILKMLIDKIGEEKGEKNSNPTVAK